MTVAQLFSSQSAGMSSTKTWVIFEEENTEVLQRTNLTTDIESWLTNNKNSQRTQSELAQQLKMISLNFGDSKYSVFDSLRQREERGDYLGWSKDILGESQ